MENNAASFASFEESYQTENKTGLMPAVNEFLEANKEWYIYRQYTNNNGLTILKRV